MENFSSNHVKQRITYYVFTTIELLFYKQLFLKFQLTLNNAIISWFEKLGGTIARNWLYFIIVPIILGCLASSGLLNVELNDDFETLYLPIRGRWNEEKRIADHYFPSNRQHNFDPFRSTTLGHYLNVIIQSRVEGENILTDHIWSNIKTLDKLILERNVSLKNETYKFYEICALWRKTCFFPLYPIRPDLLSRLEKIVLELKIFSDQNIRLFGNFSFELALGGQKFQEDGILVSAEAISLFYWLKNEDVEDVKR